MSEIWTWESIWCSLLLVSACSLIHPKQSSGKDKLHQNSITVMEVAELSLKQNAHYGLQMKMTFVEFYPVHICYEGTAQHRWILPHSLPDLNSPPFRQQSSSQFKGCKVTQNLRCGHGVTAKFRETQIVTPVTPKYCAYISDHPLVIDSARSHALLGPRSGSLFEQ